MMEWKKSPAAVTILGGDGRMAHTAAVLTKAGYAVTLYGRDTGTSPPVSMEKAIESADLVVLPIPVTRDGVNLNAPLSSTPLALAKVIWELRPGQAVATGTLSPTLAEAIRMKGCNIYDYQADECFAIRNAQATAEGAVALAISESPDLLSDASCAVLGFGRIGKQLSRLLNAMGAKVTVVSRKDADRAFAATMGCHTVSLIEAETVVAKATLIFNTIPKRLFDFAAMELAPNSIIIDLAPVYDPSDTPRLIRGASLPSHYSPRFAGELIGKCILDHLAEREEAL